jgi:hypothetical protein
MTLFLYAIDARYSNGSLLSVGFAWVFIAMIALYLIAGAVQWIGRKRLPRKALYGWCERCREQVRPGHRHNEEK